MMITNAVVADSTGVRKANLRTERQRLPARPALHRHYTINPAIAHGRADRLKWQWSS
jgi:urease alpha subunit